MARKGYPSSDPLAAMDQLCEMRTDIRARQNAAISASRGVSRRGLTERMAQGGVAREMRESLERQHYYTGVRDVERS